MAPPLHLLQDYIILLSYCPTIPSLPPIFIILQKHLSYCCYCPTITSLPPIFIILQKNLSYYCHIVRPAFLINHTLTTGCKITTALDNIGRQTISTITCTISRVFTGTTTCPHNIGTTFSINTTI